MGLSVITYALCKKYVEETAAGLGAIKGAPCTIKSTEESPDGKSIIVTFEWVSSVDPLVKETTEITIKNGTDGTIVEVTPILDTGIKIAEIVIDGQVKDIYAPNGGGGGGTSAELADDLDVTRTVGGINSGTHYEEGTSLETILRNMLNPTDYPTFVAPSASLTATGAKLLEKGATLSTIMTVTFNRGSITPAYGTSGYRSGVAINYVLNGGATQSSGTFNVNIDETITSYIATVNYDAGEQPKDSTGADYSTPLPAGSVNSNTINYEFVYALWANTTNIANISKLSLMNSSTKQRDLVFPAQTVLNPETFDVPASWTVTAVQVKNDLSGAYEDALDQFTITNTTHEDAGGNTVNYKRYTFNLGYDTGARTVRIKWS